VLTPPTEITEKEAHALRELAVDIYTSADVVARLHGIEAITAELKRRGLKAGGTKAERAERLVLVRGLSPEDIPSKLKAKEPRRK
jgi:hypothetical protein